MSWADISTCADDLRAALDLADVDCFPVGHVIEFVLEAWMPPYYFDVGSRELMGQAEGQTAPDGSFIRLREDVYEGLVRGEGRPRFTAAHELGHFVLHQGATLQRANPHELPAFRNSESQANHFAASLLMPERLITPGTSVASLIKRFGVSADAAQRRLNKLGLSSGNKKKEGHEYRRPPLSL